MANVNYLLTDMSDLSTIINSPLSAKIKYTCFDASEKYLVFGATSGSIYVFCYNNDDLSLLQIIPSKFGSIHRVSISRQEKLVAFTNSRGRIGLLEITALNPQIVIAEIDNCITVLHWMNDDKKLYLGDENGNVSIVLLSYFMVRNGPTVAVHKILLLDTSIVQISSYEDYLLVSTNSKCVLCNTEKEEFKQIGNRPRDGKYGACFLTDSSKSKSLKIFCSRPGNRIWEVDIEGNVLHTHQLKAALSIKPTNILDAKTDLVVNDKLLDNITNSRTAEDNKLNESAPENLSISSSEPTKQQRQFTKLYKICDNYLLTHNDSSFYIIDPSTSSILLWNDQFKNIESIRITKTNVLHIFSKSGAIYRLRVQPIEKFIFAQLYSGNYLEATELIRCHLSYFEEKSKHFSEKETNVLNRMREAVELDEPQMLDELSSMLAQIKLNEHNGLLTAATQMENGIFILENNVFKATNGTTNNNHRKIGDVLDAASNSLLTNIDKNIKDALISVVRGSYGKNIHQLVTLHSAPSTNNDSAELEKPVYKRRNFDVEEVLNGGSEPPIVSAAKKVPNFVIDATITTSVDEKRVQNLFLIYRSAQISNLNFLDRYAAIFDELDTQTIIRLLKELELLLLQNGDADETTAQRNCTKIYFDYLKPELIWELENESRLYIKAGFILLNKTSNSLACQHCLFPVKKSETCLYPDIGTILLQYFWSRQETNICWEIAREVPFLLPQMLKFFINNKRDCKLIALAFNLGNKEMFSKAVEQFNIDAWRQAFAYLNRIKVEQTIQCFYCDKLTIVDSSFFHSRNISDGEFYSWNWFLLSAADNLDSKLLFSLLKTYSSVIPKDEVSKKLYLKCLVNA